MKLKIDCSSGVRKEGMAPWFGNNYQPAFPVKAQFRGAAGEALLFTVLSLLFVCSSRAQSTPPAASSTAKATPPPSCHVDTRQPQVQLSGRVRDPSGGSILGATVVLKCGAFRQDAHTIEDGSYAISTPPGIYQLEVTAPGFETLAQNLELTAQGAPRQDFTLRIGRLASIVSVTAPGGYVAASATTATKTDTPLIETPQSVSVITLDQMTARDVQTLNQAVEYTAGVGVGTYGTDSRFDYLNIRGFDESVYGLFRDDMRWQSGQVSGQIDPYELQEVDVIKGPSSVLYGENTPGGLINLVTKRPPPETSNELIVNFGSFSRWQVQGDFGGPLDRSGHWLYRAVGLFRDSETQVNYVPDDRRLIAPGLTWIPSENTRLTILADYQYDNTGWGQFLPSQGTLTPNPNGPIPTSFFTGEPGYDFFHRQEWSAGYLFEHQLSQAWSFRQTFRHSQVAYDGNDVFGAGLQPDLRTLNRFAFGNTLALGISTLDSQVFAQLKTRAIEHDVLVGVDYFHSTSLIVSGFALAPPIDVYAPVYGSPVPPLFTYYNTRQPSWQTGLYFQDHIKLPARFVATLSGREDWTDTTTYDRIGHTTNEQSPDKFTGRAGVMFLSKFGVAPYFSYSTSFLPTTGVNFYGKPFLPTTGTQSEAGLKYQPGHTESFITASYFNLDESNVQTPDPNNPLNTLQTGQVRSRGVEVEGVASILRGLDLHASYTFLDEKVTATTDPMVLGKRPTLEPNRLGSVTANYLLSRGPLTGFGLGFGVRYVGTTAGDPTNGLILPSYTLLDGSLRYLWKNMELNVTATNLADKIYVGVCTSISYCNYGYRRSVIGEIRYHWAGWSKMF